MGPCRWPEENPRSLALELLPVDRKVAIVAMQCEHAPHDEVRRSTLVNEANTEVVAGKVGSGRW